MKVFFIAMMGCLTFNFSQASVIPMKGDCKISFGLKKVLKKGAANGQPDQVEIVITESDCSYLPESQGTKTLSVTYLDKSFDFHPKKKFKAEVARSSSMGPKGPVSWAIVKVPNFTKTKISFTVYLQEIVALNKK